MSTESYFHNSRFEGDDEIDISDLVMTSDTSSDTSDEYVMSAVQPSLGIAF